MLVACANFNGVLSAPGRQESSEPKVSDKAFRKTRNAMTENAILQGVFCDLKVSELPLPENQKRRVADLVRKRLDAFAAVPPMSVALIMLRIR